MSFSRNKKVKIVAFIVFVLMILGQLNSGLPVYGGDEAENDEYALNVTLFRPDFSEFDSIFATYTNYWMRDPEQKVFDRDEWALKDFVVQHELHVEGQANTLIKNMTYTADGYNWNGKISFENIKIPYNKVEVEYYNADNGKPVEPYLLHYDLYLKKADGKMILKIPRLAPKATYTGSLEEAKLIKVRDIKIGEADPETKNVYLNGQKGDDSADGTLGHPVKTFKRAKEISTANKKIKRIVVTGTTNIEGDISLSGTNAKILREKNFNGYLFRVESSKKANLSDIVIDGNSDENKDIERSLIKLDYKAELNIGNKSVLRNNKIKDITNTATQGGAIHASSAVVNMSGGSIEENQATYGGGVCLYESTMNFTGGTVKGNESKIVIDRGVKPTQYYSAGGGILALEGSTVNMSGTAEVSNNSAKEIGGGISLGSNQWGAANYLNMNGGIIDKNKAGAAGGGLFVQTKYYSGGRSVARITAGKITNNEMDGTGNTEKMFGGGGIYVNGSHKGNGGNGELYIKNAIITDNTSTYEGAGYAACPVSNTKIYVTNGVALYGNHTETNANEIYVLCRHYLGLQGGDPEYDISKRMLGGVPNNWKNQDGSLLPVENYKGQLTNEMSHLSLHTDEKGNELTKNLAKVIIKGNISTTRGGGIGSNGNVTIGEDETTHVSVKKVWVDSNQYPGHVTVKLIAKIGGKEYEIEKRQLSKENNWETTFADLPTKNGDKEIEYKVSEEKVDGYKTEIQGNAKDGFTITNTKIQEKTSVEGKKTWNDQDNRDGKRPTEIVVNLLRNGKKTASKKVKASDGWKWKFENLDKFKNGEEIIYTITEEKIKGYVTEINGYDLKNSYNPGKTSIQVTKAWKDKNNQDKKRPDKVRIKLLADGKEVKGKILVLSKTNNWTGSFTGLDEYMKGKKIKYTVKEESVGNGYESSIKGDSEKGYVVTNTRIPSNPPKTPKKPEKKSPITGDENNLSLYALLTVLPASILILSGCKRRRKDD